jgi:hypothetical protein
MQTLFPPASSGYNVCIIGMYLAGLNEYYYYELQARAPDGPTELCTGSGPPEPHMTYSTTNVIQNKVT